MHVCVYVYVCELRVYAHMWECVRVRARVGDYCRCRDRWCPCVYACACVHVHVPITGSVTDGCLEKCRQTGGVGQAEAGEWKRAYGRIWRVRGRWKSEGKQKAEWASGKAEWRWAWLRVGKQFFCTLLSEPNCLR